VASGREVAWAVAPVVAAASTAVFICRFFALIHWTLVMIDLSTGFHWTLVMPNLDFGDDSLGFDDANRLESAFSTGLW